MDDQYKAPALDLLKSYVQESTKTRMEKYCRNMAFQLTPGHPDEGRPDIPYAESMSIIMLWGNIGTIFLKIHFDVQTAALLAEHGLQRPLEEISPDMAREFIKEFSNLQGGYLRGVFEENQVLLGMSLPFMANGQDEVIFRKIRDPRGNCYTWQLVGEKGTVTCSAEICLLAPRPILDMRAGLLKDMEKNKQSDAPSDGEVEFF